MVTQVRLSTMCLAITIGIGGCARQAPSPVASAAPQTPAQIQTPVTPAQEIGAAVRNKIEVGFASGNDRLTPEANSQLDIAARLFRDVRPVSMFATGYSDGVGNEFDNLLLAARRARAVKIGLVARGIPANQVLLRSYGQSDPVDRANPNAAANRRVLVTWDIM